MTMNEACKIIVRECPNSYGKSYALAWLNGSVERRAAQYGVGFYEAKQTQALYILENLHGWGGDNAKSVRAALKAIAEV